MIVNPRQIIEQTYDLVLPNRFDSHAAAVMLTAIGLQESRFVHRKQIGGPATGFWQFEKYGGVKGVLMHRSTDLYAESVCLLRRVAAGADLVHKKLEIDDILACAFARLLLWTDPRPLPTTAEGGWDCYMRLWRPGKPHPETWPRFFEQALEIWK